MSVATLLPLVSQLLILSLSIAEIIEQSKDIDPKDKEALKALIREAKGGVSYIDETDKGGN